MGRVNVERTSEKLNYLGRVLYVYIYSQVKCIVHLRYLVVYISVCTDADQREIYMRICTVWTLTLHSRIHSHHTRVCHINKTTASIHTHVITKGYLNIQTAACVQIKRTDGHPYTRARRGACDVGISPCRAFHFPMLHLTAFSRAGLYILSNLTNEFTFCVII